MIANHSSGTVQELHLLPLTECGAKVQQIFDMSKNRAIFFTIFSLVNVPLVLLFSV